MERSSHLTFSGHWDERLRLASSDVNYRANEFIGWISDKTRQLRSIAGNNDLLSALLTDDKAPIEGTRFPIGQRLNLYHPNGWTTRLKICGVRSGGFSNVYTVVDLDEMRPYCLKENRATPGDEASKNEKLAHEAEISLLLGRSPHLVETIGAYKINGRLFLLVEYQAASSLDTQLKRSALPLKIAITYAIHICRGIIHAESKLPGFAHGDIKPGNCLIAADGRLKLGDFGLASAAGISNGETGRSRKNRGNEPDPGSSIERGGTAAYMAPELFGDMIPDRRAADIYAFGVTLFEILCGTRPFAHVTKAGLIQMHRWADPPLGKMVDREISLDLVELVDRCLSKSPAHRPDGFERIEKELCAFFSRNFGEEFPPEPENCEQGVDVLRKVFAFSALGNADNAIALVDEAILASENKAELLAAKAIILAGLGNLESAYATSTAALMKDAGSISVLVGHSRVLISRRKLKIAAEYLQRILEIQPDNCVALNLLGHVCMEIGETEQARSCLKRSMRIDGSQAEPFEMLAKSELAGANNGAAVAFARRAISIDPGRSGSHEIVASAHRACGQLIEALKSYKSALSFGASSKDTLHEYIRLCLSIHEKSGAEIHRKIVRSLIQGGSILQRHAVDLEYAEKFAETVVLILKEGGPDSNILFFHDIALAKIAEDLSPSTAGRLYGSLLKFTALSEDAHFPLHCRYSLGRILYHIDKLDDCKVVFAEMLKRFGPNESSYYYLGACAEIEADLETALKFYKKANRLLDCEDSRTGIRRVESKLRESRASDRKHSF